MDDLFTEISKKVNAVTETVLSPEDREQLKMDIRQTMQQASDVAKEAGKNLRNASRTFAENNRNTFWNEPRGTSAPPPQWNAQESYQAPPKPPRSQASRRAATQPSAANQQQTFHNFTDNKSGAAVMQKPSTALGIIMLVFGLIFFLSNASDILFAFYYFDLYYPIQSLITLCIDLLPAGIGAVLAVIGLQKIQFAKRGIKYQNLLRGADYATIADMSAALSIPEDRIRKDLKKMMGSHLFQNCYFDDEETCFILSKEVYDHYLSMKENLQQKQMEAERMQKLQNEDPNAAALEELRKTGETYIQKIRQINIALPEPEISEKLDKLENVCSRIFGYVVNNPEKLPQIRKFMSYYLPTTLKLSEAYQELELRAIETDDIRNTKQEIRDALDNINLAFQNLYANLMQKDLIGLSADISALETMLSQEGLIENDLHMGNQ